MKLPSKKQVEYLRLALNMTGSVMVSAEAAELILVVQSEMERLGGEYSLTDAVKIGARLKKIHSERELQSK